MWHGFVSFAIACCLRVRSLFAGPYQVNGVPLRRVNQAYVIATSMTVDLSGVTIPVDDDSYFARVETAKKTDEDQFFEQSSKVSRKFIDPNTGFSVQAKFTCARASIVDPACRFHMAKSLRYNPRKTVVGNFSDGCARSRFRKCVRYAKRLYPISTPPFRHHRRDGALRKEGVVCEALTSIPRSACPSTCR